MFPKMLVVTAVTTRVMFFCALLVMTLARLAPAAVQIARRARPGACVAGVEGLAMEPANPPCFLPVAFAGVACGRHGGGAASAVALAAVAAAEMMMMVMQVVMARQR